MDLESYTKTISTIVSGGYISSAICIGRDLGLFDALANLDKPVTSQQLADICNLKERISEARIKGNQHLSFASLTESLINKSKECFRKDGPQGYGYEDMPPGLGNLLGEKIKDWRKMVEQMLVPIHTHKLKDSFANVLDLGCGSGVLSMELAKQFPDAVVYGVDFILDVENVTKSAESVGIANTTFVQSNVAALPKDWTNKFDWIIMMDVLHDLPCPIECMREVRRVLKDDGVVTIVDPNMHSDHRSNAGDAGVAGVEYAISEIFCLPFSLSAPGAPGLGMGWGTEKKEKFLTEGGWNVKEKTTLQNPFHYAFTCIKSE